ncbi:MAG: bi-domain-containing oxidoreductase [Paracoccaceae bacterium]
MRQIIQSLKDGTVTVAEVPAPRCGKGQVLIRTRASLISVGTEKMLLNFGKAGWLGKARQQPDKVRQTIEKVKTDGLGATMDAVRAKLDQPIPLGYCNVGEVIEVGAGVADLVLGDLVASNGAHAEIVAVGRNLVAKLPEGVTEADAAFTVIGAIGLQGIRLASPTMGECVAVIGLGLIGLMTVQMLRAQGCRVLGIDLDPSRLEQARAYGAQTVAAGDRAEVLEVAEAFSRGRGIDAVLITAATDSNEPVTQAAHMSRPRGRIVLVGVTGLELSRADFYEKELSFQVSCSYGPGRYDTAYEDGGNDYPIAHVRWTEQRNFEAVLDLMAAGRLELAPLLTHRIPLEEARAAYDKLDGALGVLLEYPLEQQASVAHSVSRTASKSSHGTSNAPIIAMIGAGNYGGRVLAPAFANAGAVLHSIVSAKGVSATHIGAKHGFANVSTDADSVLSLPDVDTIVIATRHNAHAGTVLQALEQGKHVFVEKPLCLTKAEADAVEQAAAASPDCHVMVGFNRRFAPLMVLAKEKLTAVNSPKAVIITVNAGAVPADDWQHDPAIGGGRIVGEGCHFIDLARHLAGAPIVSLQALALDHGGAGIPPDRVQMLLGFADGSTATIQYLANGNKGFPKERIEVFCAGRILQLDNFRTLRGWGWSGFSTKRTWRQDKGNAAGVAAFCDGIRTGTPPIALDEILEVSRWAIRAQAAVQG